MYLEIATALQATNINSKDKNKPRQDAILYQAVKEILSTTIIVRRYTNVI